MKKMLTNKKYAGIIWGILFALLFLGSSLWLLQLLRESRTGWYLINSLQRLIFGVVILFVCKKLYGRTIKDILGTKGSKKALIAGLGMVLICIYFAVVEVVTIKKIGGLTVGLLVSQVILQQITTGFYEELNFRVLFSEGYFYGTKTRIRKIFYALLNFVIFGAIHLIGNFSLDSFLITGACGFTYAVIYLNSRNIFIPMLLHFVYDVIAKIMEYAVEWEQYPICMTLWNGINVAYVVMFVISVIMLFVDFGFENRIK